MARNFTSAGNNPLGDLICNFNLPWIIYLAGFPLGGDLAGSFTAKLPLEQVH